MGINEKPTISADEKLVPPTNYGVHLMSMGFLIEGDAPVIWRGPMIVKTIQQFFFSVAWGELDYLLVDLPPGTGDAQLTLCQTVPLDGGVIITTPQEASLGVVRKGIGMFQKVNVPILGIVENMPTAGTLHSNATESTPNEVVSQNPGVDLGALQELLQECGGHLWLTVDPPGNMVVKLRLPLRVWDDRPHSTTSDTSTSGKRVMGRWFRH